MVVHYTKENFDYDIASIADQLIVSDFKPDFIIGLSRGGLIPAVVLSHKLDVPMYALNWSNNTQDIVTLEAILDGHNNANFLVVDDLIDSGALLKQLFNQIDRPDYTKDLSRFRVATLLNNLDVEKLYENKISTVICNYYGTAFSRSENPEWFTFYWEEKE